MKDNSVMLPRATAMWLIDNTAITFQQIADFCNLNVLEIIAMANGEFASIKGVNPIINGQLTKEEIENCTNDSNLKLKLENNSNGGDFLLKRSKNRYISRRKKKDKPDAILWLLKNCPDFDINDICKLLNTTKNIVLNIQNKTYWNYSNLVLKNPVELGLCLQEDIDNIKLKKEIVKAREASIRYSNVNN